MSHWPETRYSLLGRLANPADVDAWHQFEHLYQTTIYRYARCRGLQESDARDVVQQVLWAVHRRVGHWEPSGRQGSFRAWLAEAVRRQTLQALRAQWRHPHQAISVDTAPPMVPAANAFTAEEDERAWYLAEAIAVVEKESNPIHWRAFWLAAVDGVTADVIADQLGVRPGTVYSVKCRILARIRQVVADLRVERGTR